MPKITLKIKLKHIKKGVLFLEKYTTPKAELVVLEMEDIIMASSVVDGDLGNIISGDNELPIAPLH